MALTFDGCDEVHPGAVGRPASCGGACAIWPCWLWREPVLERDELARRPSSLCVHYDYESRSAIRRGERVMGHGPFVSRKIQFAKVVARYGFRNDSQMQTGANLREKKMVRIKPGQSRCVAKEKMRVATEYRDSVGCKNGTFQNGVGDLRTVLERMPDCISSARRCSQVWPRHRGASLRRSDQPT